MFTYQKFFDVAATETIAPPTETPSLASIMAKSGAFNTPERQGAIPSINTETKEPPITATPATPAPATEPKPAAEAKPSSLSPKQEPTAASPQTAEPVKVPSWQEVLKSQQPDAILKELGYDERVVNLSNRLKDKPEMAAFLDHWEKKGDIKPYLDALNTDFQKMSPEEVMKHQLRAQNPELDAKQLDTLFKIKVTNRYKLDDQLYSEDEVAEGRIELLADAKPVRNQLAEEQKKFLLPTAPEPTAAAPDNQAQQRQQELEAYKTQVTQDPALKSLFSDKKILIGEGAEAFNYPVDPNAITDLLFDNDKWTSKLYTKQVRADGTEVLLPNIQKHILMAAVLNDDGSIFKKMGDHYKSLGSKSVIDTIDNAKPTGDVAPAHAEVESTNPAAAAAKRGRVIKGGE